MTPWSENAIAAMLARQLFQNQHLVVVPRCGWTGNECDLLVVTRDLRVIDVEIKISRDDLKADAKKDKWYHHWDSRVDGTLLPWWSPERKAARRRRLWPQKVWKHYYALPKDIWDDKLLPTLGSGTSGILLLDQRPGGKLVYTVRRASKPCRDAQKISAADAVDIARLASLRMWDALTRT